MSLKLVNKTLHNYLYYSLHLTLEFRTGTACSLDQSEYLMLTHVHWFLLRVFVGSLQEEFLSKSVLLLMKTWDLNIEHIYAWISSGILCFYSEPAHHLPFGPVLEQDTCTDTWWKALQIANPLQACFMCWGDETVTKWLSLQVVHSVNKVLRCCTHIKACCIWTW